MSFRKELDSDAEKEDYDSEEMIDEENEEILSSLNSVFNKYRIELEDFLEETYFQNGKYLNQSVIYNQFPPSINLYLVSSPIPSHSIITPNNYYCNQTQISPNPYYLNSLFPQKQVQSQTPFCYQSPIFQQQMQPFNSITNYQGFGIKEEETTKNKSKKSKSKDKSKSKKDKKDKKSKDKKDKKSKDKKDKKSKDKDVNKEKKEKEDEDSSILTFEFDGLQQLNGIMRYLHNQTGGNIHDNGTIEITGNSSSGFGSDGKPRNLVNYTNEACYRSDNSGSATVCFDFKNYSIQPTKYSIKSLSNGPSTNGPFLRNWVLEVSNDQSNWEEVDRHSNDSRLRQSLIVITFDIPKKLTDFYRYVRLRQTGNSWDNSGNGQRIILRGMEFFGKLKNPK